MLLENTLELHTITRMQEIFQGHVCCRCSKPAERFKVINRDEPDEHDRYYCGDCFDDESGLNGKSIPDYQKQDRYRTFPFPCVRGDKITLSD